MLFFPFGAILAPFNGHKEVSEGPQEGVTIVAHRVLIWGHECNGYHGPKKVPKGLQVGEMHDPVSKLIN
jgi:hypothetical protein